MRKIVKLLAFILVCFILNTYSAVKWYLHREIIMPLYCHTLDTLDFLHCGQLAAYAVYKVYEVYLFECLVPKVAYLGATP